MLNVRFRLGELGVRLGEHSLIDAGRRPLSAMASRGYAAEVARQTDGYFGPVAHTAGREATRRLVRGSARTMFRLKPSSATRKPPPSPRPGAGLIDLYRRYLDGRADRYDGDDALAVAEATRFDGTELLARRRRGARSVADSSRSSRRRSR